MEGFLKRNWFLLAAALIILVIAASFTSQHWKSSKTSYKVIKQAPSFQINDMNGKTVNWNDSKGKVRLVYFFYSNCPDVCLPTTYLMSRVQDDLMDKGYWGNKTAFFSITFDPTHDTPEKLKQFSSQYVKDASGWYFLRQDEKPTFDLAEKFGVTIVKDKDGNFMHTNILVLVDKDNNIRNYYDAGSVDPKQVVNDMISLSKQ
jgi:protein SCO1/2